MSKRGAWALVPVFFLALVLGCGSMDPPPSNTPEGPGATLPGAPDAETASPPLVLTDDLTPAPDQPPLAPAPLPALAPGEVLVALEDGSRARYRVQEQLASLDLPNDAVGETNQVTGVVVFRPDGTVDETRSQFTIHMDTLKSDESRRDSYLSRNAIETAAYPLAHFVPQEAIGLPWPLPSTGTLSFQLAGNMTIRETTAALTWDMTATLAQGDATGKATTRFTFGHFGMRVPQLFFILSVEDDIRLELDLSACVIRGAALSACGEIEAPEATFYGAGRQAAIYNGAAAGVAQR